MVTIRNANAGDKSFIYATWLRGLYHGSLYWACTNAKQFYPEMSKRIETVLYRAVIKVATDNNDPDLILGYAVIQDDTLHWCYVKTEGRLQGVARLLLKDTNIRYVSCLTSVGDSIRRKNKWEFYPWSL